MLRLHASIQMLHVCEQWEPSYLGGYTSVVTLPLYSRNISSNHRAPTLAYTTVQGDSLILSISLITLESVVRLSLGTHICACIFILCQPHCMRVFTHEWCNADDCALIVICVSASFTAQLFSGWHFVVVIRILQIKNYFDTWTHSQRFEAVTLPCFLLWFDTFA